METFANCKIKIDPAKHVNYAYGMVLGVDDFTQEFGYLSGRDQWMVRDLVGYGTVCGLKVSVEGSPEEPQIHVTPGTAINQQGQMIHLKRDQCALLNKWLEDEQNDKKLKEITATSPPTSEITVYVVLSHKECLTDERPIPGEPCRSEKDLMAPSRIADHYGLELTFDAPKQCEELAIRDFVRGLREHVTISNDGINSLDHLKQFTDWVRKSIKHVSTPDQCPSVEFTIDSPPVFSHIHPTVALEYLRAVFRIWITELRKQVRHNYLGGWCGCGVGVDNKTETDPEDRILLAELRVSLVVGRALSIQKYEENRPFIISLRMLQEMLLNGTVGVEKGEKGPDGNPGRDGNPGPDGKPGPLGDSFIVAAGCFDQNGKESDVLPYFSYNKLYATKLDHGIYHLAFDYNPKRQYVVKGNALTNIKNEIPSVFEVVLPIDDDLPKMLKKNNLREDTGIVVKVMQVNGEATQQGFMVEISAFGEFPG